jgi:hypothetical protein
MVRNEDQEGHLRCFDHMDTILVFASNVNWRREKDRLPSKGKSHGPFEDIDSFVAVAVRRGPGGTRGRDIGGVLGVGFRDRISENVIKNLGRDAPGGLTPILEVSIPACATGSTELKEEVGVGISAISLSST